MNKLPQNDPIRASQRKNTAARRVGVNAKCPCGELRPEALITGTIPIVCYECQKHQRGQTTFEDHHYAGKANSPLTLPIPANDHRAELSVSQMDWPKQTLQNPDKSPLLAAAASIRGFMDTVDYLIRAGLFCTPYLLEIAEAVLQEKLGAKWWVGTPVERFQPTDKHDAK